MELQWWPLLAEEDALHRCSRVRRGMGRVEGGAARTGGGATRSGGAVGGLECYCTSVALAVGTGEEGGSGESGRAHQGSKREKKDMGSKRGVRQSWWRSCLPVSHARVAGGPRITSVNGVASGGGAGGCGCGWGGSRRVVGRSLELAEASGRRLPTQNPKMAEWVPLKDIGFFSSDRVALLG